MAEVQTIDIVAGKGAQYTPVTNNFPAVATDSDIMAPYRIAVDSKGNTYILHSWPSSSGSYIYKVNPDGEIVLLSGPDSGQLLKFGQRIGDGYFEQALDIAVDSYDNLYIHADGYIYKMDARNGFLNHFAGVGKYNINRFTLSENIPAKQAYIAQTYDYCGMYIDGDDNVYIVGDYPSGVRKIDHINGTIRTVVGPLPSQYFPFRMNMTIGYFGDGGAATRALLRFPQDVTLDDAGNMYVADTGNSCIRKVTKQGIISTIAGRGASTEDGIPATQAKITPYAIDYYDGELYISEWDRIRKIDSDGIITTVAGGGWEAMITKGMPALNANFILARDIDFDDSGIPYIALFAHSTVIRLVESAQDVTPPDCPDGVRMYQDATGVTLTWNESADDVDGVAAGYKVYMDGVLMGETEGTSISLDPASLTGSELSVTAFDSSGNESEGCDNGACVSVLSTDGEFGAPVGRGKSANINRNSIPVKFTTYNNGESYFYTANPALKVYSRNANGDEILLTTGEFTVSGDHWQCNLKNIDGLLKNSAAALNSSGKYEVKLVAVPGVGTDGCNTVFNPVPSNTMYLSPNDNGKSK